MKICLAIASLLLSLSAAAAQVDQMDLYVRTTYDDQVRTVGQAAQYITEHTGYALVTGVGAPAEASEIASQPVPPIARLNRTIRVSDALLVLVGAGNCLVLDQEHRLFSFGRETTCKN